MNRFFNHQPAGGVEDAAYAQVLTAIEVRLPPDACIKRTTDTTSS